MIAKFRYFINLFIPQEIASKLTRTLPEFVNISAKFLQGIDNIWDQDAEFKSIYMQVRSVILLDKKRAYILYKFIKHCSSLEGAFAELGVYRGGGCKLISLANGNKKKIYGFDTFEGLPEMDKEKNPDWKKGQLNSSYDDVNNYLNDRNVKLIKGIFPKTIREMPDEILFSFVHIDSDLYESTLAGCEYFYEYMVSGGIILVDDYGFLSCPGAKEAVDEFFQDKPEEPIYSPSGQCFIVKQ